MDLAIKGHPTRGKEVIKTLEMLGGKNTYNTWGIFINRIYTIDKNGHIIDVDIMHQTNYKLFTLEDFLEKFPYKIGDSVIVEEKKCFVEDVFWESELNCVRYKIFHTAGSTINGWYFINNLKQDEEEIKVKNSTECSLQDESCSVINREIINSYRAGYEQGKSDSKLQFLKIVKEFQEWVEKQLYQEFQNNNINPNEKN